MTEEVQNLAEVDSAPTKDVTATPEVAVSSPEVAENQPAKTFSQEELDAAIGKRLAREQRKWEREQAARQTVPVAPKEMPSIDNFESTDAYAEALALRKAEELIAQRDRQKEQAEVVELYSEREEKHGINTTTLKTSCTTPSCESPT